MLPDPLPFCIVIGNRSTSRASIESRFSPLDLAAVAAGDRVVIHSRGCWRTAFVEKVGTRRLAVAYRTESRGHTTRLTVPMAVAFICPPEVRE